MIETPFLVEEHFTNKEFTQLGQLLLRWSHIENLVANCLKVLLRLDEQEARIVVFPLTLEYRMTKIDDLSKLNPMPPLAQDVFKELKPCIKAMQDIRGSVVHAIAAYDNADGYVFHSK